jgi:hypothetical protein
MKSRVFGMVTVAAKSEKLDSVNRSNTGIVGSETIRGMSVFPRPRNPTKCYRIHNFISQF